MHHHHPSLPRNWVESNNMTPEERIRTCIKCRKQGPVLTRLFLERTIRTGMQGPMNRYSRPLSKSAKPHVRTMLRLWSSAIFFGIKQHHKPSRRSFGFILASAAHGAWQEYRCFLKPYFSNFVQSGMGSQYWWRRRSIVKNILLRKESRHDDPTGKKIDTTRRQKHSEKRANVWYVIESGIIPWAKKKKKPLAVDSIADSKRHNRNPHDRSPTKTTPSSSASYQHLPPPMMRMEAHTTSSSSPLPTTSPSLRPIDKKTISNPTPSAQAAPPAAAASASLRSKISSAFHAGTSRLETATGKKGGVRRTKSERRRLELKKKIYVVAPKWYLIIGNSCSRT